MRAVQEPEEEKKKGIPGRPGSLGTRRILYRSALEPPPPPVRIERPRDAPTTTSRWVRLARLQQLEGREEVVPGEEVLHEPSKAAGPGGETDAAGPIGGKGVPAPGEEVSTGVALVEDDVTSEGGEGDGAGPEGILDGREEARRSPRLHS